MQQSFMYLVETVVLLMTSFCLLTSAELAENDEGLLVEGSSESCSKPSPLTNGVYVVESDMSVVQYTCRPGYELIGQATSTCQNGRWSSETPICVGANCPVVSIKRGTAVSSHHGGIIRIVCRRGYHRQGPEVMACIDGQWNVTDLPSCVSKSESKKRKTDADTIPNAAAAAAAAADFVESKMSHEQWLERSDYSCIHAEQTVSPPTVRNARYFVQWALHKDSPRLFATYQCNWGFISNNGKRTLYCSQGKWNGITPDCQYFNMTDNEMLQSDVAGGVVSPPSHEELLNQADYSCVGPTLADTIDPPVPDNAALTLKFSITEGKPHLYAKYKCREGYELKDPLRNHMYCKKSRWIGILPTCVEADDKCSKNNGECQHFCSSQQGEVSCSCKHGFMLADDQRSCVDIDECEVNNADCQHICENLDGGFACSCYEGYQLNSSDATSCIIVT